MADQNYNPLQVDLAQGEKPKKRSALGVGVTTLVTIMVILLLAAFAVLSLVSAQSNHRLAQMASDSAQMYYNADSEATLWYAELDAMASELQGSAATYAQQLEQAGYTTQITDDGELRVSESFSISESRLLVVTIAINDDTTTTIRQWQS